MATWVTSILKMLPKLFESRSNLEYGLVTLLTAGGESIFTTAVFQCPCHPTWNLPYGMVFLLVPALALFLLGFMLNTRTWRLMTGCCRRNRSQSCTCGFQRLKVFLRISAIALVPPLTWVAVGLLGGTFYECFASGIPSLALRMCLGRKDNCSTLMPKLPCLWDQEQDLQDLLKELKAQSQVAGWILIAVVIISLMIGTSIHYCRSPVSFRQLKFRNIYVIEEKKSLRQESREIATELANENVKCFFEGSRPHHNSPSAEDWQQISSLYTFNSKEPYFSTLHKYVNTRKKGEVASTFNVVEAQV
ncbi:calcium homeostasis modulator protein 6-like [Talpa occidentalis]|uniref:calcium homeostasis modulator protein 6-like n=1 Tax=Talpa occidentalis TaxID=50954 RepID=UPI00188E024E|nr:calcium homeostasis modulator protein 6-like [Talpa occidentalis]XP_037376177.1 calcium homeostasis modulator protein 6-like [Talpa occidentalis]XP_054555094.1 calcium homeostasis modulator protein 6-like [Talpa occidentalis]XP_054555095.1 calcium homeostasis modulator protein 6-like [Talpa occidentalis]XP_054555096.1 calcium homeostasis modulator protein 6-like [Talpa occidentalis]